MSDLKIFKKDFEKRGLEQQNYAELIGITPSGLSNILLGKTSKISEPVKLLSSLSTGDLEKLQKKRLKKY